MTKHSILALKAAQMTTLLVTATYLAAWLLSARRPTLNLPLIDFWCGSQGRWSVGLPEGLDVIHFCAEWYLGQLLCESTARGVKQWRRMGSVKALAWVDGGFVFQLLSIHVSDYQEPTADTGAVGTIITWLMVTIADLSLWYCIFRDPSHDIIFVFIYKPHDTCAFHALIFEVPRTFQRFRRPFRMMWFSSEVIGKHDFKWNLDENMCKFVVNTVPAGARPSADTVRTKVAHYRYSEPRL